jgi:hypothetical protein
MFVLAWPEPSVFAQEQKPAPPPKKPETPIPSGPQTDGAFRKVILDADREVNGEWQDTVKDPMELAVASDGRVFWAERAGVIKMWKPDTQTTVVIARIPVFDGLETAAAGRPGPELENGWSRAIRCPRRPREWPQAASSSSRYTPRAALDLASEKKTSTSPPSEQCCHVGGSLAFDANGNLFFDWRYEPSTRRYRRWMSGGRSPTRKSAAAPMTRRGKMNRIIPSPTAPHRPFLAICFRPAPRARPEIYAWVVATVPHLRRSAQRDFYGAMMAGRYGFNGARVHCRRDQPGPPRGVLGWPYCRRERLLALLHGQTNDWKHDPASGTAPNNTGLSMPPAQPADFLHARPRRGPAGTGRGRTAMAAR